MHNLCVASPMSAEHKPALHLEIAHVLFIDLVGYSKLLADEQSETLQLLNQIVRKTAEFRTAFPLVERKSLSR